MPLRVSLEVIDGQAVKRYNGNNQTSPRDAAGTARGVLGWQPKAAWRKKAETRRKAAETVYRRRYLGG